MDADLMTVEDVAELLAVSCETVKRHARAGHMPAAKVGGKWRFVRSQVIAWVERKAERNMDR